MRTQQLEIDGMGFTVDLDDPGAMLSMILHHQPALHVDGQDNQVRVTFADGELDMVVELVNPDWHTTGDLPIYRVVSAETD